LIFIKAMATTTPKKSNQETPRNAEHIRWPAPVRFRQLLGRALLGYASTVAHVQSFEDSFQTAGLARRLDRRIRKTQQPV
jgi:hypothetical protein